MSVTPKNRRSYDLSFFLDSVWRRSTSLLIVPVLTGTALAGSVALLSGCATSLDSSTPPSDMEVVGLEDGAGLDGEGKGERSFLAGQMNETVLSRVEEGLGVELRGGAASQADLVVRTNSNSFNYEIQRLYGPERIRIRIPGSSVSGEQERQVTPENVGLVESVALRAGDEGAEVELLIAEGQDVGYESEPIEGNLYVRLMPESVVALNPAQTGLAPTAETTASPEFVPDTSAAATTQDGRPQDGRPTLEGLRFEKIPNVGQVVVADMNSAGVFSLKRTAPSEYVLRLEGASFEEGSFPALMAPPTSNGIRTVRVVRDGADTLLRIFTNPTVQLEATPKNGGIVLRPSDAYLAANGDIRAQAELDEALESGELDLEGGDEAVDAGELGELESEISSLLDEAPKYTGRKISLDLQDTDIDNALRIIAEVSNLNIIASDDVTGKVTLRLIDVPWDQALDVILKTNGLDKVLEGNVMRIAPIQKLRQEREALKQAREAEEELEPLVVKYIRVSYAKSSELRPLVETVLTERGTVTFDERTNQLIVKDIRRGVRNVAELVARLDLRTPQVLLETQIVEATRSFSRSLGSELGFSYIQSPATGNPTGYNFPNSVNIGGSVNDGGVGSSFPVAVADTGGSAVSLLLDSADGTRSLDFRLTALEDEGAIRVVSRPSVATTNNQQATIKSVEKVRIKTPSGGLSVATGAGANATGNGGVATETIEIGIVLEVTPQASPDYFVLLDINAKSSTFGAERVDDIPSEIERSATSSVLVSSGQTFAMGGIYKITDADGVSGVPFLKDMPFLGHLFRRQSVDNSDEELIFFITPRIIEGSFDDAAMKLSS
ncbi:type IV pilus secretin PilQ [bacterium]|nr:type IV pilus secretin PilQ [bacterium]